LPDIPFAVFDSNEMKIDIKSYSIISRHVEWDVAEALKYVLISGAKFLPAVGGALSFLMALFWQSKNDQNIWTVFLDKIKEIIEQAMVQTITGILKGDLAKIEEQIDEVVSYLKKYPGSEEARSAYINLAHNITGTHRLFVNFSDDINFQILPMYSCAVLMQVLYWTMGIENSSQIGLNIKEVNNLRDNIEKVVSFANKYITDLYDNHLENALLTSTVEQVANNVMSIHGHCRLHGVEYL
ncbi:TPA: insecticidal delta-endotoxin Cry8Ea1 family protein, partial [Yersinia enterocolitica]